MPIFRARLIQGMEYVVVRNCLYKGMRCRLVSEWRCYNGYKFIVDTPGGEVVFYFWPQEVELVETPNVKLTRPEGKTNE